MKTIILALLSLTAPAFAGDFVTLPGATTRYIFVDGVNAPGGKAVLDVRNNRYLFGSTTPVTGIAARVVSSGTVVIQSTSSTNANDVLQIRNNAGSEIMGVTQQGRVGIGVANPTTQLDVSGTINATMFTGDGSALSGLPGLASTITWSGSHYFPNRVTISSPTSQLIVGSSITSNGGLFGSWDFSQATPNYGVVRATVAIPNDTAVTGTIFSVCVATITQTFGPYPVRVSATIYARNASNFNGGTGVLMDGTRILGQTTTQGLAAQALTTVGDSMNLSFNRMTLPLSPGSHSFCLMAATDGGTLHLSPTAQALDPGPGEFAVEELR